MHILLHHLCFMLPADPNDGCGPKQLVVSWHDMLGSCCIICMSYITKKQLYTLTERQLVLVHKPIQHC